MDLQYVFVTGFRLKLRRIWLVVSARVFMFQPNWDDHGWSQINKPASLFFWWEGLWRFWKRLRSALYETRMRLRFLRLFLCNLSMDRIWDGEGFQGSNPASASCEKKKKKKTCFDGFSMLIRSTICLARWRKYVVLWPVERPSQRWLPNWCEPYRPRSRNSGWECRWTWVASFRRKQVGK